MALGNQRPNPIQILTQNFRAHRVPSCRHPVDIPAQRIDLAIVANHAKWLSQIPGREGVGGKALMHQGQRRGEAVVVEVAVITPDLSCQQHPLVVQRARRHRGDVIARFVESGGTNAVIHLLANHEQLAFEAVLIRAAIAAGNEHLADDRFGRQDALAQIAVIHRYVAPTQYGLPTLAQTGFDDVLDLFALLGVAGQKQHANAIQARWW